jgi:hypothetical protein
MAENGETLASPESIEDGKLSPPKLDGDLYNASIGPQSKRRNDGRRSHSKPADHPQEPNNSPRKPESHSSKSGGDKEEPVRISRDPIQPERDSRKSEINSRGGK